MFDKITPIDSKWKRYLFSYASIGRKDIGFYSNFGHGDSGDDAFLYQAQDLLDTKILPMSKRCYTFNPHRLKAFLLGGASLFHWQAPYIPRRLLKKKKWPFPVILYSAGINCDYGASFSQESLDKIHSLCSLADYITVRDLLTKEFIANLGFPNAEILPDLELMVRPKKTTPIKTKDHKTVGITLTPHSAFNEETFKKIEDLFVDFTNWLTDNKYTVLFIPFDSLDSESTREKKLLDSILKRIKSPINASSANADLSPEEILNLIQTRCDFMVSMRLHSAVFAVNANVPFFCLSYNMMHKGFLQEISLNELELPLSHVSSTQKLQDKFQFIVKNSLQIKRQMTSQKIRLCNEITKQNEIIKNLLK
ncbi:MAG: polysaccharide pyruvyl transferase family protein [Candidatus Omnitrophica bacterium]|nr:polysaccharide pyruvyl transferase family protein [Candidatus Omnitrophota bacterium]